MSSARIGRREIEKEFPSQARCVGTSDSLAF
jgi:hypothetical protein